MKKRLTELHILQPIVNGGVNRDENGALKTATIGGYDRLRISSQSWKRAIREFAKSLNPELFGGFRTRYLPGMVSDALLKAGLDAEKAAKIGPNVAGIVGGYRCYSDYRCAGVKANGDHTVSRRVRVRMAGRYIALTIITMIFLFPIFWLFAISFKTPTLALIANARSSALRRAKPMNVLFAASLCRASAS